MDADDESDWFFANAANRQRLESMPAGGSITNDAAERILAGDVHMEVASTATTSSMRASKIDAFGGVAWPRPLHSDIDAKGTDRHFHRTQSAIFSGQPRTAGIA